MPEFEENRLEMLKDYKRENFLDVQNKLSYSWYPVLDDRLAIINGIDSGEKQLLEPEKEFTIDDLEFVPGLKAYIFQKYIKNADPLVFLIDGMRHTYCESWKELVSRSVCRDACGFKTCPTRKLLFEPLVMGSSKKAELKQE